MLSDKDREEEQPFNADQGGYGVYEGASYGNIEATNRKNFIKKVYGILAIQLAITSLFTGLVVSIDDLRDAVEDTFVIALICMILTFIISIAIVCSQTVAKKVPVNYIALLLFTICETYIVGYICAFYDSEIVLIAAIMTLGVTVALTIYAWTTKTDFTTMGGLIWVLAVSLLLFGFLTIFFYDSVFYMIFCFIGVVIYGIFLIYDTQLIAGGRYRELGYDDYIIGSLLLYIDIIGLFLYLLSLLGKK